ncbi:MAG: aminopeptidase [Erysipelotrichaceae bacterium]|nr:aminopeptidase [Erysipelotrichaceae bacterium]MDP3304451.1 aminopeptidase [Erysipelotrichaceae bacterium]
MIEKLRKYAQLAVCTGVNVQKGQTLVIQTTTDCREFARLCVEEAYKAGAGYVFMRWNDDPISKITYTYADVERLEKIPTWLVDQYQSFMNEGACALSIYAPTPGLLADIDPMKIQRVSIASQKALKSYREYMMGNKAQWSLVSVPTVAWAKKVFPLLSEDEAVEKLWEAIFAAVRVDEANDAVADWAAHNARLAGYNKKLNDLNFKSLHFKNDLGTDLVVELVEHHHWAGGAEVGQNGVVFNPNIPTEEAFTMPKKTGVNGTVVSTKPLNYQGRLVENFKLTFKGGAVVDFSAEKEEAALKNLLNVDEGSKYLGEVALISHNSPISNSGVLFLNTLFDENASCHLALGRAYPMNVEGGNDMNEEELLAAGANMSMEHVDFMFGSADMKIVGTGFDGSEVVVFDQGNFVI